MQRWLKFAKAETVCRNLHGHPPIADAGFFKEKVAATSTSNDIYWITKVELDSRGGEKIPTGSSVPGVRETVAEYKDVAEGFAVCIVGCSADGEH